MSNKYLVIKLTGNWIDNEQITGRIKFFLEDIPCAEVLENAVAEISAAQIVSNEQLQAVMAETFKEHIKKRMSVEFGDYLFGQGLINFAEEKDRFATKIVGSCKVIMDGRSRQC